MTELELRMNGNKTLVELFNNWIRLVRDSHVKDIEVKSIQLDEEGHVKIEITLYNETVLSEQLYARAIDSSKEYKKR